MFLYKIEETNSLKNLPSISVQLTAISEVGILNSSAKYRSSTSNALKENEINDIYY